MRRASPILEISLCFHLETSSELHSQRAFRPHRSPTRDSRVSDRSSLGHNGQAGLASRILGVLFLLMIGIKATRGIAGSSVGVPVVRRRWHSLRKGPRIDPIAVNFPGAKDKELGSKRPD